MEQETDPEKIAELVSERDAWLYRRMLDDIEHENGNCQTRIIMNLSDDKHVFRRKNIASKRKI